MHFRSSSSFCALIIISNLLRGHGIKYDGLQDHKINAVCLITYMQTC